MRKTNPTDLTSWQKLSCEIQAEESLVFFSTVCHSFYPYQKCWAKVSQTCLRGIFVAGVVSNQRSKSRKKTADQMDRMDDELLDYFSTHCWWRQPHYIGSKLNLLQIKLHLFCFITGLHGAVVVSALASHKQALVQTLFMFSSHKFFRLTGLFKLPLGVLMRLCVSLWPCNKLLTCSGYTCLRSTLAGCRPAQ